MPYTPGASRWRDEIFAAIQAFADDGTWPIELTGGFSSYHTQRCNFLFGDGSVRSVHNSIDMRVYRLLGNRADGDPIGSDSY
jgi:prepilin-type processing-associated H-X9-DG protein